MTADEKSRQIVIPFHTSRAQDVAVIDNLEDMERLLGPMNTGDDLIAAGQAIREMLERGREETFQGGGVCLQQNHTRFVGSR